MCCGGLQYTYPAKDSPLTFGSIVAACCSMLQCVAIHIPSTRFSVDFEHMIAGLDH